MSGTMNGVRVLQPEMRVHQYNLPGTFIATSCRANEWHSPSFPYVIYRASPSPLFQPVRPTIPTGKCHNQLDMIFDMTFSLPRRRHDGTATAAINIRVLTWSLTHENFQPHVDPHVQADICVV